MDVSFINPFVTATIECFTTMLAIKAEPLAPILKKEPYPTYDISGVIGLSGEAQGSISLSYPNEVAIKFVTKMLGTPVNEKSPDLIDAIGEFANIIAGNAKKDLSKFNLSISLPNVIIGKAHILVGQSGAPTILVPFKSPLGMFAMEVSLKTK
ncbi:MAG TPA: chemotaxis protein CheX [Chitinispirillaceae bacterium]|nr:chemotaxis protein CheX [Chitinispirillaceae bacterium]